MIQEAYQVLKSPDKRTSYDQAQSGEQQFKSEPTQENANPSESSDQGFQFSQREYTKAKDSKEVEEDFKKFMEQPIKIDPGKMKIYENSLRRAMGKELREQQDYIFKRNHKRLYQWAYGHMLGYTEHVRLYISSLNLQFKKKRESKEEINIKTADFYAKWGNMIIGTIFLLTGPLLYSAMSRRKEIEAHMKADEEVATKMIKEFEYMNVLARLVY